MGHPQLPKQKIQALPGDAAVCRGEGAAAFPGHFLSSVWKNVPSAREAGAGGRRALLGMSVATCRAEGEDFIYIIFDNFYPSSAWLEAARNNN